ncbi:MAG: GNAT family N-acetyltransferase [Chloroflexota bacterium]|nr:GNAT family N-acetyltransferase [Chloroflexota bacterium]
MALLARARPAKGDRAHWPPAHRSARVSLAASGRYDPISRWTEIEPLGTHAAFRRLGLARAVVREVIHRSWQRGAEAVMVWSTDPRSASHVNEPAFRLYTSSGMQPERCGVSRACARGDAGRAPAGSRLDVIARLGGRRSLRPAGSASRRRS